MKTLLEDMEYWRAERPDEWKMDEFIKGVQQLQTKLAESEARVGWLIGGLEHIAEYWNQDRNDQAMFDALMHIEDEVYLLIDETKSQSLQHIEAAAVEKFIAPLEITYSEDIGFDVIEAWRINGALRKLRQQSTNNGSDEG